MLLDADMAMDRRRTRRKLTFWRVVAFLLAQCNALSFAELSLMFPRAGGTLGSNDRGDRPQACRLHAGL